ncbi:hypothetical protein Zmor_016024 [Zophobas morio]|uniref:Sodium/potassium-transporting ATPase subunit beta-2 n=1 Tax=Zophobas morio TaxID=2755281 RepID=A0AA38IKY8_9CUCU|nr:hypothetical protein Zmor_016024 [Zophobas morio]
MYLFKEDIVGMLVNSIASFHIIDDLLCSRGITVRPVLNDNPIEYRAGDSNYMRMWNEKLTEFLEPYLSGTRSENVQNCFHQQYPDSGKVCNVKLTSEFTPCLPPYNFGFDFDNSDKGPCIFLKLNKIFDWVPKYYHKENIPADMPTELAQKIINAELVNQHDKIWVDCRPNNVSDVGNLGDVSYYPQQGFEGKYFPYTNVEGYLSPLVAVHFEKPKRGIPFDIVCKAWAANIQHDRKYNKGLVRFTLHVH